MIILPKDKKYSILFIGNSYTYYNDMPTACFAKGAKSLGYDLTVESVTAGGYTLARFADDNDREGARLFETVRGKHYNCIIFQEQSVRPHTDPEKFLAGLIALWKRLKHH